MSFQFRPAVRENASTLIALAGPSGGGKTFSALRLARGLAGPDGRIALIDTEAGRSTHYVGRFQFDRGDMAPPFSPTAYMEAIDAADKARYAVVIIDSASHEWAGDGGCIDIHDAEVDRMAGDNWAKREAVNVGAWKKPKHDHKRLMSRLLQCRAHLIFCLRAEEKIRMEKVPDEKTGRPKMAVIPLGWQPICEKNFMYEMTASFMLSDTAKWLPTPIKLQEQHRAMFPLDQPIGERAGQMIAAWARGADPATGEIPKGGDALSGSTMTTASRPTDASDDAPAGDATAGGGEPAYNATAERDLLWQGALAETTAGGLTSYWEMQREVGAPGEILWQKAPAIYTPLARDIQRRIKELSQTVTA